ncbi:synaptojanin-2-binding protein isoform X1 [Salmo salar]|uniref:Synaptojanin-2-binding protein isoform X1 n=1 Tax=Salmo salar TaxID=8030 RepID=A0ABM3F8R4_SALSA|nr:synaptojanin-2-binding protein-like isoform X1 [Salmo salar]
MNRLGSGVVVHQRAAETQLLHEFTFTFITTPLKQLFSLSFGFPYIMNGSAKYTAPTVLGIQLKRGPQGLGFNIVGGLDQQYVLNDSGIYVAKIKENGAAALDGRLQEGDKILAVKKKDINGQKLENLSHSAAVELFRSAGEDVQLRVQQRPTMAMNGPTSSRLDGESSVSSLGILVAVLGAAAAITFLYMRFQPQLRRHF